MNIKTNHLLFIRQMLGFEVDRCKEAIAKKLYISLEVIEYRQKTCIEIINLINKKYGIKTTEVSDFEKHERVEVEDAEFTEVPGQAEPAKVHAGRNRLGFKGHSGSGKTKRFK